MARATNFKVTIFGLKSSMTVPGRIERAEDRLTESVGDELVERIGTLSESRQITAGTHASVHGDSIAITVGEGVPFAIIRERGGTIRPKTAKILKYANGQFRPRSYVRGTHYVARALDEFSPIVEDKYREWFFRI